VHVVVLPAAICGSRCWHIKEHYKPTFQKMLCYTVTRYKTVQSYKRYVVQNGTLLNSTVTKRYM
jgi:hypothetical protein